jgi:hypothetical protein
MLSRRVKRNFNLTPLKHAEQLCADTKYKHQNIPCVCGSCTYQRFCLHETNIPQANDSYSDGQKYPTFMKRKCNYLPTIHGQKTLSWTNSVKLHLTTELSKNHFGFRTLFLYTFPLSAFPSNFRNNDLYEFIFRQLHPSRLKHTNNINKDVSSHKYFQPNVSRFKWLQ